MATLTEGLLGGGLRGKSGNAVFVRTKRGTVVRDRVIPHDPMTPAQMAARQRQARAARAWGDLDPAEVAAWTLYARSLNLQPNNAFATLYKVLLRLNPAAPVPTSPPSLPFFGDVISINVSLPLGRGRGGVEDPSALSRQAEIEATPTLPSPKGEEATSIIFAPSGPNSAGIVTELLIQPLASRNRRTYLEKYRHLAFTTFPSGSAASYPLAPGWYACAYRFVNASTGQITAIAELGPVQVA